MVKKQFIAGAKCPRCNGLDKIRACKSETREWMECVACGYEEERPTEGSLPPEEAPTAAGAVKWTVPHKQ
ncbi:MAG TPA: metal-binding protein [Moraxellaceae bacterium]|nr:metal-binding protein [Moraxellaceae bacterium]